MAVEGIHAMKKEPKLEPPENAPPHNRTPEPREDHIGIPAGAIHDEPKGTPHSDRYYTEIASARHKRR